MDFSEIDSEEHGDPVALVYDPGRPGRAMTAKAFTTAWWRTDGGFLMLLGMILTLGATSLWTFA